MVMNFCNDAAGRGSVELMMVHCGDGSLRPETMRELREGAA